MGLLVGMVVAGVTQSSVATSVITVGLVEGGIIPFSSSVGIIMGANVGTTVTAQLVSLSGGDGNIIAPISAILGIILLSFKSQKIKEVGKSFLGLSIIFTGLAVMGKSIGVIENYSWFKRLFLIKNPLVLFINGMMITAITQSSSAITGCMIILASKGSMPFINCAYITLGSNVGSCFGVILASLNKGAEGRRTAVFNLIFNLFGSLLFMPVLIIFGKEITNLFLISGGVGRGIANFHTSFNLVCSLIATPFLKPLCNLVSFIVKDDGEKGNKNSAIKSFRSKSRYNI